MRTKLWSGSLMTKNHFEDLDINGRILKRVSGETGLGGVDRIAHG
jgi:hypothetical protein